MEKKYRSYKLITAAIIIALFAAWFLTCNTNPITPAAGEKGQTYHLAKIKIADTDIIEDIDRDAAAQSLVQEIRSQDLRYVSNVGPGYLWVIVTDQQWEFLRQQGYAVEHILRADELTLHKRMVWGPDKILPTGYHTYEEMVMELKTVHKNYPRITDLEIIGKTQQFNKDIYALKLSDHADISEDEPRVLFSAAIHGNEIMGAEVTLALLKDLLGKYRNQDEEVIRYIHDLEIWFVPVINVDGYVIATTLHPSWRKNARDNDGDGKWSPADGVDLNRNFDFNFAGSGSGDPASKFYRGPFPFSERETQVIADLVKKQKFLFSYTYHSAESRVYYPWRDTLGEREIYTPEDELLREMAQNIAGKIKCINEDYTYEAIRNTKKESYTTNYYYAEPGTIDFMIELGKYDHVYPQPALRRIMQHNLPAAYYLLKRSLGPGLTGIVTEEGTGRPLLAEVQILTYDDDEDDIKPRTTDPRTGRFYRALLPGTYTVVVKAAGWADKRFDKVVVADSGWIELNCRLSR